MNIGESERLARRSARKRLGYVPAASFMAVFLTVSRGRARGALGMPQMGISVEGAGFGSLCPNIASAHPYDSRDRGKTHSATFGRVRSRRGSAVP